MRFTTSRVLIFLLFAVWISGMLYFFSSSSNVEPLSPGEHARLVQAGKVARERDHRKHESVDKKYDFENNIVIGRDPNIRNKVLNKDSRSLNNFGWKEYVQRGALKPGEDKNARNAYNQEASEKLAWDRPIPDVRDSKYDSVCFCQLIIFCQCVIANSPKNVNIRQKFESDFSI